MPAVSHTDYAWAAGLFEGEGSFSLINYPGISRGIKASMCSTDEDVLHRFCRIVNVGRVGGPYKNSTHKPYWRWQIGSFEGTQAVIAYFWNWFGLRRRARATDVLTWGVTHVGTTRRLYGKTHAR